jgi:hypothetical protein
LSKKGVTKRETGQGFAETSISGKDVTKWPGTRIIFDSHLKIES